MSPTERGPMEKKNDLRVEKTYLALHQAFTSLLEEKKFEDFTVNELCQRAMIRRTTFYKHFADKYEYFTFFIREISNSFLEQLPPEANPDNLPDYYSYMSAQLLQFVQRNEKLVRHVMESTMFPVLLNLLTDYIRTEFLQKLRDFSSFNHISSDILEILASFYAGGMTSVFLLSIQKGSSLDSEVLLQTISSILAQSIEAVESFPQTERSV